MNKELQNVLKSIWKLEELSFDLVMEKEKRKKTNKKKKKEIKIIINDEILVIREFFENSILD